jgi:hypothetical protein
VGQLLPPKRRVSVAAERLGGWELSRPRGCKSALADAFETWAAFRFEIQDIRQVDDRVVVLGRTINVGKGDAPAVEYQSAYLAKLRDGKIAYWRPYQSHVEALEAVGLSE